jgi:hypothetical protein
VSEETHVQSNDDVARWVCYVDTIDDDHVHLIMADDLDEESEDRYIGAFPRHLLLHLEPVEGQHLKVRITADETIMIEEVPATAEAVVEDDRDVSEIVRLLRQLRGEDDQT